MMTMPKLTPRKVQIAQLVISAIVISTGFWYYWGVGASCIAFGAVMLFDLYFDSFFTPKG